MGRFGSRARQAVLLAIGLFASACSSGGDAHPAGSGGAGSGGAIGSGGAASGSGGSGGQQQPPPPPVDAAGDATATDAAATDTGGDETSTGVCPSGSLLCDGFESYGTAAELTAAWRVTANGAMVTVDNTKAFVGTRALHIRAPAGTPNAVISKAGAPLFPIAGNVMWGRVMMWLTATPPGAYHWNTILAGGPIPGSTQYARYGWGGQVGKVLAGYTVHNGPTSGPVIDCSKPSAMAFPDQSWACVEWQFDSTKNEMHLWFNGTLLADADIIGKGTRCVNSGDLGKPWTGPAFDTLTLGWQQYQGSTGPLEMWFDDLAVSTQRLGCPKP